MDQREHRGPYPDHVLRALDHQATIQRPEPPRSPIPPDRLAVIEQGIRQLLWGQQEARQERKAHASEITAELEDIHEITETIAGRVDILEQGHQEISKEQTDFRLEIEQRINKSMWWMVTALVSGLLGLLWAAINRAA